MAGGGQQPLPSLRHQTTSSAPPAHSHAHHAGQQPITAQYCGVLTNHNSVLQYSNHFHFTAVASPKHPGTSRGVTRPAEQQYMIISSPKKAKYSIGKNLNLQQLANSSKVTPEDISVVLTLSRFSWRAARQHPPEPAGDQGHGDRQQCGGEERAAVHDRGRARPPRGGAQQRGQRVRHGVHLQRPAPSPAPR